MRVTCINCQHSWWVDSEYVGVCMISDKTATPMNRCREFKRVKKEECYSEEMVESMIETWYKECPERIVNGYTRLTY